LHQRASSPIDSFIDKNDGPNPQSSSSGDSGSTVDECKVDIRLGSQHSLARKPSRWERIKRKLSSDHTHDAHGVSNHSFENTEILPDDLEYIEGGDIVHSETHDTPLSARPSIDRSHHVLSPVSEERSTESAAITPEASSTAPEAQSSAKKLVKGKQPLRQRKSPDKKDTRL